MKYLLSFLLLVMVVSSGAAYAQSEGGLGTDSIQAIRILNAPTSRPNRLNVNDRITQLYSAVVGADLFSGKDGKFEFKSSLFGLGKIFHPEWDIDTDYLKRAFLRKVEISAGFTFNEKNKLQSFQPAVKWAVVNKRDRTQNNFYLDQIDFFNDIAKAFRDAGTWAIRQIEVDIRLDSTQKADRRKEVIASMEAATDSQDFSKLDETLKMLFPFEEALKPIQEVYDRRAAEIDKGLLITLDGGWKFTDDKRDSLFVGLELFKGIQKKNDLVFKSRFAFKDTSATASKFTRTEWLNSAALDLVLVQDKDKKSLLEFSAGMEYMHILRGRAMDEDRGTFKLVFTLSALISENIAVPFTLKWDPKDGNVFALFDLQWMLSPIGKK